MNPDKKGAVAIVGMAGRFPAAGSVAELWQLLLDGRGAVRRLDEAQLRASGVSDALLSDPAYVPYAAEVSGVEYFDAGFFAMTPSEAAMTDPQQRLLMECAWQALEDGGVPAGGRTGVFSSTELPTYLLDHLLPRSERVGPDLPYSLRLGNQPEFLPTRLAYVLGLTGPAVTLSSACSSSLIAVDAACTALTMRRCDVAIAGAAAVRLPQATGYLYQEGGTWSRDGQCRPFDARSTGWVAGNGAAAVVLKRFDDAVADRDRIYAVIAGIGVNNDGADKISFTAPSTSAQMAVIADTVANAGVATTDIGYVEAHGTGTALGDPIEVTALTKAYARAGGLAPGCGLGSIKANLGHMACAAGMASLVKTALVLHHQVIPPQVNFTEPNPLLPLDGGGLVIYDTPYRPAGGLRAAAVTSLGMGGTNAHMILVPAPHTVADRPEPADRNYAVRVSARTTDDLRDVAGQLHEHLLRHEVRIDDLAYTLDRGRTRWDHSFTIRARTLEQVRAGLRGYLAEPAAGTSGPAATAEDHPIAIKISLPPYPLRRERHWIDPARPAHALSTPRDDGRDPDAHRAGDLQDEVLDVFRARLGIEELGPDDDFEAVGGSSITAMEIVDAIADRLGPTISLTRFLQLRTARRVTEEARAWVGGNSVDPLTIQLRDGARGDEIFFIYPVNGSVFCYHRLALHTTFARPVYAIAYPVSEPDPPRTTPAMAARCITEIRNIASHGPYRLAGYSMGGNVSVEIAHQLEREGEQVRDIVMVDALPPEAYPSPQKETDYLRAASISMSYFLGLPIPDVPVTTVDDVLEVLRRPTWSRRTEEFMRRSIVSLVANAMEVATARPPAPIDADITVLSAVERHNPAFDALGVVSLLPRSWQRYTNGRVTSVSVPGNHYTLYTDPGNFAHLAAAFDRIYGDDGRSGVAEASL